MAAISGVTVPPPPDTPPDISFGWSGGVPANVTGSSGNTRKTDPGADGGFSGAFKLYVFGTADSVSATIVDNPSGKLSISKISSSPHAWRVNYSGLSVNEAQGITVQGRATNAAGTTTAEESTIVKRIS